MSEIIKQYGEVIIAGIGTLAFIGIFLSMMLANDGLLARMIYRWGMGGFI